MDSRWISWPLEWVVLIGIWGCTESSQQFCGGECPLGQVCDTQINQCVDPRPPNCPDDLGRYLALALDSQGRIVFSSYTAFYGDLVVGILSSEGPQVCEYVDGTPSAQPGNETLSPQGLLGDDVGLYSALALDSWNRPHVAYFDRTHGRLKYAQRHGDEWEIQTVPEFLPNGHVVGRAASLALSSEGLPRIAYVDVTGGDLLLARKFVDNHWEIEKVPVNSPFEKDLGEEVGRMVSLVLDLQNREWIVFRDQLTSSLEVAGYQLSGWSVIPVDSGSDMGSWISAALDSKGNMAVAYHDRELGALKYAWNQSGALKKMVVDDGRWIDLSGAQRQGSVGQHCTLVFGSDGLPRIFYLDAENLELRVVQGLADGGFSKPQILDSQGPVGFFNAAILRQNQLVAGSCRYSGRDKINELDADITLYQLEGNGKFQGVQP